MVQLDGSLKPAKTEKLEDCVREDCYVNLSSFNRQGIPIKKSKKQGYIQGENICYWYPRNRRVAWLDAVSVRANLYCYADPDISYDRLGVRVKFFSNQKQ